MMISASRERLPGRISRSFRAITPDWTSSKPRRTPTGRHVAERRRACARGRQAGWAGVRGGARTCSRRAAGWWPATCADGLVWYAANAVAGRDMLAVGAVLPRGGRRPWGLHRCRPGPQLDPMLREWTEPPPMSVTAPAPALLSSDGTLW